MALTMARRRLRAIGKTIKNQYPAMFICAILFYWTYSFLVRGKERVLIKEDDMDIRLTKINDGEIAPSLEDDAKDRAAYAKKRLNVKKKLPSTQLEYHVLSADNLDVPLKYYNIEKLLRVIDRNKKALDELGIPYRSLTNMEVKEAKAVYVKHPVMATAFSSNHFEEAKSMFQHLVNNLLQYKVIVYDLGLMNGEITEVESILSKFKMKGEIRKFPFQKYSKYNEKIHHLYTFSWKALIIQQLFQEFGFVFYMDTSVKILSSEIQGVWPFMRNFGVGYWENGLMHSCFTHPAMFQYFNVSRSEFKDEMAFDAGAAVYYNLPLIREVILPAYVACSLDKDCISPEGSSVAGCNSNRQTQNVYCGCHRFDQSAITLILSMIFPKPRFTFSDPSTESNYAPYALQDKPGGRQLKIERS